MAELQAKHVKASGPGTKGELKKDGYAAGSVPISMRGSKPGKTSKVGYTGPNVARATGS